MEQGDGPCGLGPTPRALGRSREPTTGGITTVLLVRPARRFGRKAEPGRAARPKNGRGGAPRGARDPIARDPQTASRKRRSGPDLAHPAAGPPRKRAALSRRSAPPRTEHSAGNEPGAQRVPDAACLCDRFYFSAVFVGSGIAQAWPRIRTHARARCPRGPRGQDRIESPRRRRDLRDFAHPTSYFRFAFQASYSFVVSASGG
jgi:hypothetical protein